MAFEDYKTKPSVVVVYTGDGKGKTSASLGLMCRALGRGWKVAYMQFIKEWEVGEHGFIRKIAPLFKDQLAFQKGGKGFYNAGELSDPDISAAAHKKAARAAFKKSLEHAAGGRFQLVICDEINNAVNDGLLSAQDLRNLITKRAPGTSLCLTGRNFPPALLDYVDIATNMGKIKHHFDDKFLANKGIDY